MSRKRFINQKQQYPAADVQTLPECMKFIENMLKTIGTERKLLLRTLLIAEEVLGQFLEHASPEDTVRVRVKKTFGDAQITIRVAGSEYDPYEDVTDDLGDLEDEDAQRAIRSILLKAQGEKLKFSYKNGVNSVRIQTGGAERSMLHQTIAALVLGLIFGVLMQYVFPQTVSDSLNNYLLNPVQTIFMNALKAVIAPVVFFSMVSCISQFKDLSELGRLGAKVMGTYIMTTIIAIILSLGLSLLINPGEKGFALSMTDEIQKVDLDLTVNNSFLQTVIGIVPSNFLQPFVNGDTLQIMFLAVICGIAVGLIGEYSDVLKNFFEACNSLFLTVTTMITRFVPIAVFCSIALMIRQVGGASLVYVLSVSGTVVLALFCMMVVYGLLILVLARLNPLTFYKKHREGMLTSFTLSSSAASMPANMKDCTEYMGISPKICSFSIPLGATVNMDGACMTIVIFGLFLAKAYGIDIPASGLLSMMVTTTLLSLSCPGIPCAGMICVGIVLKSIGVPVEALGLIIGVYPILDMFSTMSNTTGDVAAALIVAKREGLVDLDKYRS
ncbi:MAG: cation:dicarboxylase symporter family transporter [Clostridiales bacterium]|nr:cation:dicarboxylase symporter family transporter [Clostridiales bacterium]